MRECAVLKLQKFCSDLSEEGRKQCIIKEILPIIDSMTADENRQVKIALAKVVMSLAPLLGIEHLSFIFLAMLRDDIPEVREKIISSLNKVILFLFVVLSHPLFFYIPTPLADQCGKSFLFRSPM